MAKLNAVGHRWVGELADFRFDIRYWPGKSNADADTLSRLPLDIDRYVAECTEEWSKEAVCETWEGSGVAEKQDVAYVAALNLAQDPVPHGMGPLPTIDHDELVKAQREDPANWGPNKIEGHKGGLVKCRQTKCEWPPAKTHA